MFDKSFKEILDDLQYQIVDTVYMTALNILSFALDLVSPEKDDENE